MIIDKMEIIDKHIKLNKLNISKLNKDTVMLEQNKLGSFLLFILGLLPIIIYLLAIVFFNAEFKLTFLIVLVVVFFVLLSFIIVSIKTNKILLKKEFVFKDGKIIYWRDVSNIYLVDKKSDNPRLGLKKYILIESKKNNIEFRIEDLNKSTREIIDTVRYFWSISNENPPEQVRD